MISFNSVLTTSRFSALSLHAGAFALAIFLSASLGQAAQSVDTTQVARLRSQLQNQIQQVEKTHTQKLDSLEKAVTEMQSSLRFYERVGIAVIGLLTVVGMTTIWGFIKRSARRLDKRLEKAIYKVDPRDMPIKLPATGMEKQLARLKELEFTKLSTYQWLDDDCTRNAVVVLATNDQQANELKNFIQKKGLEKSEDIVFVVFTKGAEINRSILKDFDNVTLANNHLTLVQALFVAARGIVRPTK